VAGAGPVQPGGALVGNRVGRGGHILGWVKRLIHKAPLVRRHEEEFTIPGAAHQLQAGGDELPQSGRYPIHQHGFAGNGRWFHLCFSAGTTERPKGVFHSESGWVIITAVKGGGVCEARFTSFG
jgi:hypothetical protein